MTTEGSWRLIAMAGLLAMLLFAALLTAGMWVANLLEAPLWMGWLTGAVMGFLCSRAVLRRVLSRELG